MVNKKEMKVIILAGGFGSRLDEATNLIPKPLVKIGKNPIIIHIMKIYLKYNIKDFYIALGYKGDKIAEFFLKKKITQNIKKKLKLGLATPFVLNNKKCRVTLIDTGLKTMTGGRVKRVGKILKDNTFLLTYGDGVANVNLSKLINLHFVSKKMVTVTAVNPPARFGELKIKKGKVFKFSEKKSIIDSWINGGFFVINKKFFKYIKNDQSILEREPLEKVSKIGQLMAYKHFKFWQCMDTKRDRDKLNYLLKMNQAPWLR
tara:strand:- start:882 stop:1661 length:780 start_codon:yes stop_codon:yes gene_type:complete